MNEFKNTKTVITGVNGDIALSIAKEFYKNGSNLILFAKKKTATLSKSFKGKNVLIFYGNLCDETFIQDSLRSIKNKHNKIDFIINCAGRSSFEKIDDISLDNWKNIINDNLTSTFLITKYLLKILKKNSNSSIVNISSIAGKKFSKLAGVHYTASKAGVIGFTRQLSIELSKSKIRVNTIAPGQVNSKMLNSAMKINNLQKKDLTKLIPLGRLAAPSDIANCCIFLCSSNASYITGTTIDINGGLI
mgnify:FL=1